MVELKGKGFLLRPFRKSDAASLQRNINNPKIAQYTLHIAHPYTPKNARDWISRNQAQYRKKAPEDIAYGLEKDGGIVGSVGLHNIKGHTCELGYWLAEQYWGQGIITEATRLMTAHGFKRGLCRIQAEVFAPNKASARVLEKAGYQFEGRLRKKYKKNGKFFDALLYAKVR